MPILKSKPNPFKFIENIKNLRLAYWLSQKDISDYLWIRRSRYCLLEKNDVYITIWETYFLSKLFNITIDSLFYANYSPEYKWDEEHYLCKIYISKFKF